MKVYQAIATLLQARINCAERSNGEWTARHTERLEAIVRDCLPSGSGCDNGTTIVYGSSTPDKLAFVVGFHHMDEHGSYDGWTHHTVTVIPSLCYGFKLKINGRDRNGIKEYLADIFHDALMRDIDMNHWITKAESSPQVKG